MSSERCGSTSIRSASRSTLINSPNGAFRVVQLTPPGSSCSIQIGKGLTDAPIRSLRNVYLVFTDLAAARSRLLERAVEVGEIRHKTPIGARRRAALQADILALRHQVLVGRVEEWRHTRRSGLSVNPRFLWECLINRTVAGFHPPPRRTERADFPHSALLLASQEGL